MKKHMKPANMKIMLGLLAVLFISLGYLSMQGREGMTGGHKKRQEGMTGGHKKKQEGMTGKAEEDEDELKEGLSSMYKKK